LAAVAACVVGGCAGPATSAGGAGPGPAGRGLLATAWPGRTVMPGAAAVGVAWGGRRLILRAGDGGGAAATVAGGGAADGRAAAASASPAVCAGGRGEGGAGPAAAAAAVAAVALSFPCSPGNNPPRSEHTPHTRARSCRAYLATAGQHRLLHAVEHGPVGGWGASRVGACAPRVGAAAHAVTGGARAPRPDAGACAHTLTCPAKAAGARQQVERAYRDRHAEITRSFTL
jgi:hypothetical protein